MPFSKEMEKFVNEMVPPDVGEAIVTLELMAGDALESKVEDDSLILTIKGKAGAGAQQDPNEIRSKRIPYVPGHSELMRQTHEVLRSCGGEELEAMARQRGLGESGMQLARHIATSELLERKRKGGGN